jgi:hypothetical protein
MLTRTFEYREDNDGNLGFIPVNAPAMFNAGDGRIVAHDMLEHFSNTTCSWEDELLALGAMIYVRGEYGYFTSNRYEPEWEVHLASDLLQVMGFVSNNRQLHDVKVRDTNGVGEGIDHAIAIAYSSMLDERMYIEDAYNIEVIKQQLPLIRKWLIKGYNKANVRYRNGFASTGYLFCEIEKGLSNPVYQIEGSKTTVIVNLKRGTVKFNHTFY